LSSTEPYFTTETRRHGEKNMPEKFGLASGSSF
jgi:hypothetical protein